MRGGARYSARPTLHAARYEIAPACPGRVGQEESRAGRFLHGVEGECCSWTVESYGKPHFEMTAVARCNNVVEQEERNRFGSLWLGRSGHTKQMLLGVWGGKGRGGEVLGSLTATVRLTRRMRTTGWMYIHPKARSRADRGPHPPHPAAPVWLSRHWYHQVQFSAIPLFDCRVCVRTAVCLKHHVLLMCALGRQSFTRVAQCNYRKLCTSVVGERARQRNGKFDEPRHWLVGWLSYPKSATKPLCVPEPPNPKNVCTSMENPHPNKPLLALKRL